MAKSTSKHRKALKRTFIALLVCLPPLLYLAYHYRANIILDVNDFGVVPEFQMMFVNHERGMTHIDTTHHVSIVAVLKDQCIDPGDCKQFFDEMASLKAFFKTELAGQENDPNTPLKARFIIQSEGATEHLPQDWDIADMSHGTPYLVPEVKSGGDFPALVLIDDGSYYRGFVSYNDPLIQKKLRTELTRIISNQYLLHYVSRQTLMWRKANGREKIKSDNQSH